MRRGDAPPHTTHHLSPVPPRSRAGPARRRAPLPPLHRVDERERDALVKASASRRRQKAKGKSEDTEPRGLCFSLSIFASCLLPSTTTVAVGQSSGRAR